MNRIALIVLSIFIGVGAVAGGVGLIAEAGLGMDTAWLEGTPFSSYVVPGYILLIVVGGSNLLAATLLLINHEKASTFAFLAGAILTVWIVAQVAMIGLVHLLQPIYFVFGLMLMGFAYRYWVEINTRSTA